MDCHILLSQARTTVSVRSVLARVPPPLRPQSILIVRSRCTELVVFPNRYDAMKLTEPQPETGAPKVNIVRNFADVVAPAIGDHSIDMVFLDSNSGPLGEGGSGGQLRRRKSAAEILQEIETWHNKVRYGGILVGHDFRPDVPEVVEAVCAFRAANEVHLGADGTFWWYVEPPEE